MKNRLTIAILSMIDFVKNPVAKWDNTNDQYEELRDISFLTLSLTMLTNLTVDFLDGDQQWWVYLIYLPLVIGLARVVSWLVLNFYALILDYYLDKLVSPRLKELRSNLILNQRIAVYASITTSLAVLPFNYTFYLIAVIETLLIGYGISIYYNLELSQSMFISAVFNFFWNGVMILIFHLLIKGITGM